jgi:hypothetical protein
MKTYLGSYEKDGKRESWIYYGNEGIQLFIKETFNPLVEVTSQLICLNPIGKSYQDRKEQVREIVYQAMDVNEYPGLSYGEYAELNNIFSRLAKRYGLIREFKSEGLIY